MDSARLIVRQNFESNGFEIWRLLHQKFALPDATRHVSLLTQLLDFKFNPSTFESDFNTWETIKNRYEQQVGSPLPDGVLVATLLNKTRCVTTSLQCKNFANVPADKGHNRRVL